jgi:uncharacterized repeat protein (TIGR04138 family)
VSRGFVSQPVEFDEDIICKVSMDFENSLTELLRDDRRYKIESYRFVNSVLNYAIKRLDKETAAISKESAAEEAPFVSGREICYAARDYALEQYGFLARTVLYELGIRKTEDIGQIVFNLFEIIQIQKNVDDQIEDFCDVFDLGEELDRGFRFIK